MNGVGWYGVAIGISVGLMGTALGIATADAEFCPARCSSGKVPLGISAPITGPSASFGQQAVNSVEFAFGDLIGAGGLRGSPVPLFVDDARCAPGLAAPVPKRKIDKEKIVLQSALFARL